MALRYPPSQNGLQKSLASALNTGVTASMTLNNTTNIQNKPGVCVVDRIDSGGTLKSTSVREYVGYAGTSGATLTTLTRNIDNSSSDQDHAIGAVVEFIPDVTWGQAVIDALANLVNTTTLAVDTTKLVDLTTSQTLTNKILTAPSITTPTITKPIMNATDPSAQTYTPSGGGTATLDLSLSNQHFITMPAGNITIALSNDTHNQPFIVSITQDSSGSRTVTFFTTIKWATGTTPTLTTTANKRDTFGFIRTGSGTYDGFVIGQNI